jgi:hypothetical protein
VHAVYLRSRRYLVTARHATMGWRNSGSFFWGSDPRLHKEGRPPLRVSWGIQLVGVEESSERKSVLSGSRQWNDSPETVSGSAGGPGPWRVETQSGGPEPWNKGAEEATTLWGDNQWRHARTKKISVCVCVCVCVLQWTVRCNHELCNWVIQ